MIDATERMRVLQELADGLTEERDELRRTAEGLRSRLEAERKRAAGLEDGLRAIVTESMTKPLIQFFPVSIAERTLSEFVSRR